MSYSIGVDIGGKNIAIGIVNTDTAKILTESTVETKAPRPAREVAEEIVKESKRLCACYGIDYSEIDKIGVGTPGAVKNNTVSVALNLGWEHENLGEMITELSGRPTYVANDANVAAYAEAVKGVAKDTELAVMVTVGKGVGGGIVSEGRIWEGYNGFASEIGHMIVEKDGRECVCGKRGCLEAYCSAEALIRDTKAAMQENKNSVMWEIVGGDINAVNGKTVFSASRLGDACASEIVNRFIDYLAIGVANVINALQPEVLCIGGGISGEGENLLKPLRERLEKLTFCVGENNCRVVAASFGNKAGIIGAALLGSKSVKEASDDDKIHSIVSRFVNGAVLVSYEPYEPSNHPKAVPEHLLQPWHHNLRN